MTEPTTESTDPAKPADFQPHPIPRPQQATPPILYNTPTDPATLTGIARLLYLHSVDFTEHDGYTDYECACLHWRIHHTERPDATEEEQNHAVAAIAASHLQHLEHLIHTHILKRLTTP